MRRRLDSLIRECYQKVDNPNKVFDKELLDEVTSSILEGDQSRHLDSLICYIDRILKSNFKYETLILSIQILINCMKKMMPNVSRKQIEGFFSLYMNIEAKLDEDIPGYTRNILECAKSISTFYYDFWKQTSSSFYMDIMSFRYLSRLIDETNDFEAVQKILSRQPYLANVCDENFNSLICKIWKRYIQTKDPRYINFAIIFLECPDFVVNESDVKKIQNEVQTKKNLKLLGELLDHYFVKEADGSIKLKRGIDSLEQFEKYTFDGEDLSKRVDLTSLRTVTFKNTRAKDYTGIDRQATYSLYMGEEGIEIYYHIPDMTIIFKDREADARAKHLMESFSYESSNVYLAPKESLNKFAFKVNEQRPAITFRLTLDKESKVRKLDVFESFISVDKIYECRSSLNELKKSYKEMYTYRNLARLFHTDETYSLFESITEPLTDLLETSLMHIGVDAPFIYRNVLSKRASTCYFNRKLTSEITEDSWDKRKTKMYKNLISSIDDKVTIYSSSPLKMSCNVERSIRIADPEISYVALENMRAIKKAMIDGETTDRFSKDRAMFLSMLANTLNRKHYFESSSVRKILQNY